MSNRSLLELNHDHGHKIDEDPAKFNEVLQRYLSSASKENAADLERYGVRVFGMRHHSEGFDVRWGSDKRVTES